MEDATKFQNKPDYYSTPKECVENLKIRRNSNPKYPNYEQVHFTAGDIEQFSKYRDASNGILCIPDINISNPVPLPESVFWEKYKDIPASSIEDTFSYIFYTFRKGIFIKIKNGKVKVFLPFTKNEGKREFDTTYPAISNMLKTLSDTRKLPDMEFFVNPSDIPILNTEHAKDPKYSPVLGLFGSVGYADIPIPMADDWSRAVRKESKFFPHNCGHSLIMRSNTSWKDKKSIAFFRGKLQSPEPSLLVVSERITSEEQTKYKYFLNLSDTRLGLELESGCCVLLAQNKYKLWYRDLLKPYVHYVPVKQDLSDLIEKIKWCQSHDEDCEKIAKNAKVFVSTFLGKEGILNYLQQVLYEVKKQNGVYFYNSVDISTIRYFAEVSYLQDQLKSDSRYDKIYAIPMPDVYGNDTGVTRNYGHLKAVEKLVQRTIRVDKGSIQMGSIIFQNNDVKIQSCSLFGYPMVRETKKGDIAIAHEAFISLSTMNEASKYVPNFTYVFGYYKDSEGSHIISEYSMPSITLNQYIQTRFEKIEYISILIQVALALQVAQNFYGFIHGDLTTKSILLKMLPRPQKVQYQVSHNKVYTIETSLIPIIMGFEKANVFKSIIPYNFDRIKDIASLIASGPEIGKNVKYTTPIDFVHGIAKTVRHKFFKMSSYKNAEYISSPKQVIDYSTLSNNQDRLPTYLNTAKDIVTCGEAYKTDNPFFANYVYGKLLDTLMGTREDMVRYLKVIRSTELNQKIKEYDDIIANFKTLYLDAIDQEPVEQSYTLPEIPMIRYTESIFLEPEKLLELLEKVKDITLPTDIISHVEMVFYVLGRKDVPVNNAVYYNNFKDLLRNFVQVQLNISGIIRLRELSKIIFTENIKEIGKPRCKEVERYLDLCNRIVKV